MAKQIIPLKILISLDNAGNIIDGLLQYQINDASSISGIKSVSVRTALTDAMINSLFTTAVSSAKTSEGI